MLNSENPREAMALRDKLQKETGALQQLVERTRTEGTDLLPLLNGPLLNLGIRERDGSIFLPELGLKDYRILLDKLNNAAAQLLTGKLKGISTKSGPMAGKLWEVLLPIKMALDDKFSRP